MSSDLENTGTLGGGAVMSIALGLDQASVPLIAAASFTAAALCVTGIGIIAVHRYRPALVARAGAAFRSRFSHDG